MIYVSKSIWLKKFISLSILILSITFWYSFAQDSGQIDKWDCNKFWERTWWDFWTEVESRQWKNEIVYPKESIIRAILNLKAYCCEINILWSDTARCQYDKVKWLLKQNHPDSKYLYDHLIDIWFRRLDAMDKLLYEKITPDPIWKERRDFINKKWSQEEGTTPIDILPKFKEQWTINKNYILADREDWNYNTQYQNEWTWKAREYNNRPLVNRYSNLCEIAAYIYWYLWLPLWDYTRKNWYPWCKSLSRNIISRNISFTKAIVLKKSNKLLYDNINTYITNYISQSRLEKLKETILWIVESLNVINKKVVKLIEKCW